MFKHPHDHPHDPDGHGVQAQGHGDGRRHLANRQGTIGPQPQRRADHDQHRRRIERRHRPLLHRKHPHQGAKAQALPFQRRPGKVLFPLGMGEQFYRLDIGITIHNPPGDTAIGIAVLFRRPPGMRGKPQRKTDKCANPQGKGQGQPQVHPRQQNQHGDGKGGRLPERLEQQKRTILDRDARAHHPVGQPPGKVILEKPDRLAQHVLMRPPTDLHQHIGGNAREQQSCVKGQRDRPQQQQNDRGQRHLRPILRPECRGASGHQINHPPRVPDQAQFQHGHSGAHDTGPDHHPPERAKVRQDIAHRAGVWCHVRIGRERIDHAFDPAEQPGAAGLHSAASESRSSARNPPD